MPVLAQLVLVHQSVFSALGYVPFSTQKLQSSPMVAKYMELGVGTP
jgi:hypothetical protein